MIDITDLTTAINSFKAIVAEAAVTPTSLGTLLQSIVNALGGALSESDKTELQTAINTAVNRIEAIEKDLVTEVEHDKDTLILGKYYNIKSVGETMTDTPGTSSSGANCGKFKVEKGRKIKISVLGGTSNVRGWGLTDNNLVVLSRSDASVDTRQNPITLTPTVDGWLFVNCMNAGLDDFFVKIEDSKLDTIEEEIDDIEEEVNENTNDIVSISQNVEDLDDRVSAVESELLTETEYDKDTLILGKYYNIKSVGETMTDTPGTSSSGANCGKFKVEKGRKMKISVLGGTSNARGWGLTDNNLVVLSRSEESVDTRQNPITLTPTVDGWLFVNCMNAGLDDFFVKIEVSKIDAIEDEIANIETEPTAPRYHNNPLPIGKSTLKVLAIGNSFTADSLSYLADMVSAAGISASNLCVYGVVKGGSSMDTFVSIYDSETSLATNGATCTRSVGSIDMSISDSNTLAQVLAKDWDIVVLNQYSQHAYSQVNPSLTTLIFHIRENCTNQAVSIAWHGVWSYQSDKSGYLGGSEAQWADLQKVTKMQMTQDGVDIIIPTGTAIQNARNTSLVGDSDGELTRDGAHMAFGVGRYIVAATWFQTLLAPIFGVSIIGNTCVHDTLYSAEVEYDEALQEAHEEDPVNNMYFPPIYVTTSNRELCQLCAMWATIDKWTIHGDNNE